MIRDPLPAAAAAPRDTVSGTANIHLALPFEDSSQTAGILQSQEGLEALRGWCIWLRQPVAHTSAQQQAENRRLSDP